MPWIDAVPGRLGSAWSVLLAAWFAGQTYGRITTYLRNGVPIGLDARIYYRAVTAWLAGHDPWQADVTFHGHVFSYAGTPVTTVLLAPAGLLSEDAFVAVSLGLSWGAAIVIVRRLRLPTWWLLFPPLSEVLYSGNPQLIVLALLLVPGALPAAISVALKVYALAPLVGERRWRDAIAAVAVSAATFVVAPGLWFEYARSFGQISARLAKQAELGFSAFYFPGLAVVVAVALLALARRDRRRAGWLAVPALWPASEFHYSTFALPVMSPLLAVLLAIPTQRLPPVAITLEVIRRLVAPPFRDFLVRRSQGGAD